MYDDGLAINISLIASFFVDFYEYSMYIRGI